MNALDGPLTEARLNSADADVPESAPVARRLIICTTPRSGSYLFSHLLIRAGLGLPHEYLNPTNVSALKDRVELGGDRRKADEEYLQWLDSARTTPNGVFAAKIHWEHFERSPLVTGRWLRDPSAVVVFLTRRSLGAQARSWLEAAQSGVWEHGSTVTTRPSRRMSLGARSDVDRRLFLIMYSEAMWRLFFEHEGIRPLELVYEDVVADQVGAVQRVAAALDRTAADIEASPPPSTAPDVVEARQAATSEYVQTWQPAADRHPLVQQARLTQASAYGLIRSSARSVQVRLRRPG